MLRNSCSVYNKKLSHCFLRCPNDFILIHHLNPILLTFKHKDEKLSCTIAYFYVLYRSLFILSLSCSEYPSNCILIHLVMHHQSSYFLYFIKAILVLPFFECILSTFQDVTYMFSYPASIQHRNRFIIYPVFTVFETST